MKLTKEEAIRQLQRSPITFNYDPVSWDHYKSADYQFDFSTLTWTREMNEFFDLKATGEIPREIAERFLEKICFVSKLSGDISYMTESERKVPATEEEQKFLGSKTKRLAQYRAMIGGEYFRWVPDMDIAEPYCNLTAAFEELLTALDI